MIPKFVLTTYLSEVRTKKVQLQASAKEQIWNHSCDEREAERLAGSEYVQRAAQTLLADRQFVAKRQFDG